MKKWSKAIALLVAAVMICLPITACSGGKEDKAKETLTFAQGAEPRGLDPALVDDGESSKVIVNIYEGLLKYNKDSTQVEPCLADSWDISKDGLTYTFKLHKGVKFQDGTDFDADAVKFNIDRQLPPKVTDDMSYASFVFGSVKSVDVVDKYTVKINMSAVCTPFLANLAMSMAAPMVSPKALKDNKNNVNEHPVGTGPYKFVRWDKGQDVVLVRNDDYWGTKAKTKNVIFKIIADNSARVVALNNGEVDMIDGIDATVVDKIKQGGNTLYEGRGMNINYMAYNTSRAPFNNAKTRIAVSQSVNVPELVKSLYQGYAEPATTILPSFIPGYDSSVSQVKYDADAAKAAITSAGLTKVHMITYTNARPYNPATGQSLAEAIQGYLSKVGITCTIDAYDWTTYKEKVKAGDYDICFYGWTGDNGDPDNFLNLLADSDPTMNVALYKNQDYIDGIQKGLITPNGDERNKIYGNLEKIAAADAPWLPISHMKQLSAYSPKVEGYYYHVTGNIFFAGMSKK